LGRSWWQRRSRKLRDFYNVESLRNILFCHEFFPLMTHNYKKNTVSTVGLHRLAALTEKYEPDVIFLDPLSAYYGLRENDTDLNRAFVNAILKYRRFYNQTLVIVHHDRKAQAKATEEMRGSGALEAGADSSVQLTRDFKRGVTKLQWNKVRHARTPLLVKLEQKKGNSGFFTEAPRDEPKKKDA
ncbi:MAG: AAA family ATPase, partial [Candidatus Hydrogenedentes bacterium]|nr:AAA family ATPase [Candidatus Hydrogenedentota bacterium]